MNHRTRNTTVVLCVCGLVALLAGCGGGDTSNPSGPTAPIATPTPSSGFVSRASVAGFSRDALILSSRLSSTAQIRTDIAQTITDDLARIRTQNPYLAEVTPVESPRLNEVLVSVAAEAPFNTAWLNGTLTTGEPALDTTLAKFEAESVRFVAEGANTVGYLIRFGSPLNTSKAGDEIKAASANISSAEENGIFGSSRDVLLTVNGAERVYTFTQGKGDCPAGCIEKHFWRATVAPDGNITIVEGGDPL